MDKYAVFGDLHGDIGTLERFLDFLSNEKEITHVFFTGDFFGLDHSKDYRNNEYIRAERDRQYAEIEWLLEKRFSGKKLFAVPGNYDLFGHHFQLFNFHHKSTYNKSNKSSSINRGFNNKIDAN